MTSAEPSCGRTRMSARVPGMDRVAVRAISPARLNWSRAPGKGDRGVDKRSDQPDHRWGCVARRGATAWSRRHLRLPCSAMGGRAGVGKGSVEAKIAVCERTVGRPAGGRRGKKRIRTPDVGLDPDRGRASGARGVPREPNVGSRREPRGEIGAMGSRRRRRAARPLAAAWVQESAM
jgi:hypothetical protein